MTTCVCPSIQELIWRGNGQAANIIGSDHKFYRYGAKPALPGDYDAPGSTWDSGSNFDTNPPPSPGTTGYDQSGTWDGSGETFDQAADPSQLGQVSFDETGAAWDDGLSFDQPGILMFTRKVSLNAEDMTYRRPNKYGKATWYGVFDATGVMVGDYHIGPEGTFFVATLQPLLPILVVECNRTARIVRPQQQSGVGILPYGGNTQATETPLIGPLPCSILQGTKGEKSDAALPGDTRAAWWTVLMPYHGIDLFPGDIMIDELKQRYVISSNERTDAGYRMTSQMALP